MDLAIHTAGDFLETHLESTFSGAVTFGFSKPPKEIVLDEKSIPIHYFNGKVSVSISEREQVVRIRP